MHVIFVVREHSIRGGLAVALISRALFCVFTLFCVNKFLSRKKPNMFYYWTTCLKKHIILLIYPSRITQIFKKKLPAQKCCFQCSWNVLRDWNRQTVSRPGQVQCSLKFSKKSLFEKVFLSKWNNILFPYVYCAINLAISLYLISCQILLLINLLGGEVKSFFWRI